MNLTQSLAQDVAQAVAALTLTADEQVPESLLRLRDIVEDGLSAQDRDRARNNGTDLTMRERAGIFNPISAVHSAREHIDRVRRIAHQNATIVAAAEAVETDLLRRQKELMA